MVFLIFIHSFSYFFYYTNHVDMASEKRLDHSLVYRAFFFIFASSSEPGFLS